MKQITAFIKPHMEGKVVSALHDLPEFPGFTVIEARGQGHGRGAGGSFVATEMNFAYHPRCVLIVTCEDEQAEAICRIIIENASTGLKGDGIVSVSEVAQLFRIRPGRLPEGAFATSKIKGSK